VTLAQDALLSHGLGGVEAAIQVARERNGTNYGPYVVERFCEKAETLLAGVENEPSWEMVLSLEPGTPKWLSDEEFDAACEAMADFVDIKSPSTLNHSPGVAALAAAAAEQAGLPASDVRMIQRACWLHGLGKTGVSASILERPGALTEQEWER